MRKLMLLTVVGLLALPAVLSAQPLECLDCKLGIWDEPELINNTGTISTGVPKDLYLGVRLAGSETGITGLEFSVTGLLLSSGFLVFPVEGLTDPLPNVTLGSVPAPADTTASSSGTGGMNVAYPSCISGSGALLKITILYSSATPLTNHVLKVIRKFPPSNTEFPYLLFTRCDAPEYTKVAVPGGCYILNWDGTTDPVNLCNVETAVEESTWSGMKQLYR